jgi:serine/threonine-protein kinase
MSAVYLARQERPRRLVAVKALRPSLAPGREQWPVFLARFRREADAMAALDHANITPIYEFGEQDDLAYLVMPYMPDGSLSDALGRQGPLPVERAIACVEQVAAALDYAHQHGIIHRDVKPSNVLIHPDGRLLLADFGIARPLDKRELPRAGRSGVTRDSALTMAGFALGTPDFMAPEQVLGQEVSPATDVYALGALTYTLLSGHTPFGGGGAQQTLDRQLREPPQPLRLDRPDIPPRVEEAIFWALAKDPAERPASAGALAKSLRASLRTGPLAAGAALLRRAGMPGQLAALSGRELSGAQASAAGADSGPVELTRMQPSAPDAVTVWDARYSPRNAARGSVGGAGTNANGAPVWPSAARRLAVSEKNGARLSPALIAGITVALAALVVMAFTLGGLIGGGGNPLAALTGSGAPTRTGTTPSPTASPSPSPSPTVPPDWLAATPSSITLACNGSKRTQDIHLINRGNVQLDWQEQTDASFGYAGISVSPSEGTLEPGQKVTIIVKNTTLFFSHSGQIVFSPNGDNADGAGSPAVVSYTANCGGG